MTEEIRPGKLVPPPTPPRQEPGLFDTIGSFPVWLLKIIDALTPDSLKNKPQEKKKVRI